MQSITSAQREWLLRGGIVTPSFVLTPAGTTTPISIEKDDVVEGSLHLDRTCTSGSALEVGSAETAELTFSLFNHLSKFDNVKMEGAELVLNWDINGESLPGGIYTIDQRPASGQVLDVKALDRMARFNRKYETTIVYPANLSQILNDACTKCGVTLASTSFANREYVVQKKPDTDTTYHDIVGWVAALAGCNAHIGVDGQLYLRWFDGTAFDLSDEAHFEFERAENRVTITGITFNSGDQEYMAGSNIYALDVSNNDFVAQSPTVTLAMIHALIGGFSFLPYKNLDAVFLPHLWPGDKVNIFVDGVAQGTIVTRNTLSNGSNISAAGEPEVLKGYATGAVLTKSQKRMVQVYADMVARTVYGEETSALETEMYALNEQIANSLGYYQTTIMQVGGGSITYTHDQPHLEDSMYIDTRPGPGQFAFTTTGWNNGTPVWEYGVTQSGSLIMRVISAIGINAEWVKINGQSITHVIDQKAKVFSSLPQPPYTVGDVWAEPPRNADQINEYGPISTIDALSLTVRDVMGGFVYICRTSRLTGSFVHSDWALASVDDQVEKVIASRVTTNEQRLDQFGLTISETTTLVNQQGEQIGIANQDITIIKAGQATFATKSGLADPSYTTINGGNITTGLLRSQNGYTQLNLNTGTFSLANGNLSWDNSSLVVKGELRAEQSGRTAHVRHGQYMLFNGTAEILNISNFIGIGDDANIVLGYGGKKLNFSRSTAVGSIDYAFMTFDGTANSIEMFKPVKINEILTTTLKANLQGGADIGRTAISNFGPTGAKIQPVNSYGIVFDGNAVYLVNPSGSNVKQLYP